MADLQPPSPGGISRRTLLKWTGAAGALAVCGTVSGCVPIGPGDPGADANGLVLREGFTSRIIAEAAGGSPARTTRSGRSPTAPRPLSIRKCPAAGTTR